MRNKEEHRRSIPRLSQNQRTVSTPGCVEFRQEDIVLFHLRLEIAIGQNEHIAGDCTTERKKNKIENRMHVVDLTCLSY